MRVRTFLIMSMGMLLLASLSSAGEPAPTEKPLAPPEMLNAPPRAAREIRIFALQYQNADEVGRIIATLTPSREATITSDGTSQKLIVAASPERLQQIEAVIRELDVRQASGEPEARQVLYRIYMLELPSEHLGLRPFSLMATGSAQLSPERVLNVGLGNQVQIESFRQSATDNGPCQFKIAGRAASNEAIERLTEKIPDCQIMELEWEDVKPVMLATQVAPLPKSLQEHIRKLLGDGVGIVGYWFGNLSVPGRVGAPIGPWSFEMSVDRLRQQDEVELEISVVRESQDNSRQTWQILSNSMRCKIDRPVIIGYNRDNHGVQTMGALVIVPEDL